MRPWSAAFIKGENPWWLMGSTWIVRTWHNEPELKKMPTNYKKQIDGQIGQSAKRNERKNNR